MLATACSLGWHCLNTSHPQSGLVLMAEAEIDWKVGTKRLQLQREGPRNGNLAMPNKESEDQVPGGHFHWDGKGDRQEKKEWRETGGRELGEKSVREAKRYKRQSGTVSKSTAKSRRMKTENEPLNSVNTDHCQPWRESFWLGWYEWKTTGEELRG